MHLSVDALHRGGADAPVVIWRNPRVVLRVPPQPPAPDEPVAVTRARVPGPIVETRSLRSVLPADVVGAPRVRHESGRHAHRPRRLRRPRGHLLRDRRACQRVRRRTPCRCRTRAGPRVRRPRDGGRHGDRASAGAGATRLPGRPGERGLSHLPCRHRRVPRADAAELARGGEPGRQGSGAGAVRQHLQQPRARRLRHDGQVPAHRRLLHPQHRRRQGPHSPRGGLGRSVRIVAVPRRVPRHAAGPLRREGGEPDDRGDDAGPHRGAAGGRAAAGAVAPRAPPGGDAGHASRGAGPCRRCAGACESRLAASTHARGAAIAPRVLSHGPHDARARPRRGDAGVAGAHPDVAVLPVPARGSAARHGNAAERLGDREPPQLLPLVLDP